MKKGEIVPIFGRGLRRPVTDNLPPKDPNEVAMHRNLVATNIRTHLESLKRKLKED